MTGSRDGEDPPGVATGIVSLYHGDEKVGEARIKTQPGHSRSRATAYVSAGTVASR